MVGRESVEALDQLQRLAGSNDERRVADPIQERGDTQPLVRHSRQSGPAGVSFIGLRSCRTRENGARVWVRPEDGRLLRFDAAGATLQGGGSAPEQA
jgi:hypothetical protein